MRQRRIDCCHPSRCLPRLRLKAVQSPEHPQFASGTATSIVFGATVFQVIEHRMAALEELNQQVLGEVRGLRDLFLSHAAGGSAQSAFGPTVDATLNGVSQVMSPLL